LGPLNFGHWSLFRISRFVLRIWPLGVGACAGGIMRQTNPISRQRIGDRGLRIERGVGRGRPTYEEAKCAKRTQFQSAEQNVRRAWRGAALHAGATPDQVGGRLYEEAKCAKRTQLARPDMGCPDGGVKSGRPTMPPSDTDSEKSSRGLSCRTASARRAAVRPALLLSCRAKSRHLAANLT
jgi:hypothetical protein